MQMTIILSNRNDMQIDQYTNVSNIAYNATTHIYTITYGSPATTTTYDGNKWVLTVLIQ